MLSKRIVSWYIHESLGLKLKNEREICFLVGKRVTVVKAAVRKSGDLWFESRLWHKFFFQKLSSICPSDIKIFNINGKYRVSLKSAELFSNEVVADRQKSKCHFRSVHLIIRVYYLLLNNLKLNYKNNLSYSSMGLHISVLPNGRSFTANTCTMTAVLPKGRDE